MLVTQIGQNSPNMATTSMALVTHANKHPGSFYINILDLDYWISQYSLIMIEEVEESK